MKEARKLYEEVKDMDFLDYEDTKAEQERKGDRTMWKDIFFK